MKLRGRGLIMASLSGPVLGAHRVGVRHTCIAPLVVPLEKRLG